LVVFTHVNLARIAPALPLARRRTRYVVCSHGIEVWRRASRLPRLALRRAAGVVASTTFTTERLVGLQGVDPARIATIALTLEPSWIEQAEAYQVTEHAPADGAPLLLSVCRLDSTERYKGVDAVLRALPAVQAAVPGVEYEVVGEGDDLPRLKALAADLGVLDAVRFAGSIGNEELLERYRRASVFVLPSAGEGFGLVFLEAMAFGKPIVAAAAAGALDVVRDGVTGRLLHDDAEIGPALADLLTSPDAYAAMSAAARREVAERFSFAAYRAGWEGVLERAVVGGENRPPKVPFRD
jgi:glycosyltransferase involved in cell wall biosynthesis